jgi:hypothetical protein
VLDELFRKTSQVDPRYGDDGIPRLLEEERPQRHARHYSGRLDVQPVDPVAMLLDHVSAGANEHQRALLDIVYC